jgi:hypothetical protein
LSDKGNCGGARQKENRQEAKDEEGQQTPRPRRQGSGFEETREEGQARGKEGQEGGKEDGQEGSKESR